MKNRSIINEEEKLRILNLHEHYKTNVVSTSLIIEAENIIPGGPNDDWDYKESGNKYYARKKGTANWILATGSAERAIKKDIFKRQVEKIDPSKSPFKSQTQGNEFRKFVNKYYKYIAKKHSLDIVGPFNNSNIINASEEIIPTKKYGKIKLGDLFFKQNKYVKQKGDEPGVTLPSLIETGFKVNRFNWKPDHGYYVDKCTQEGCAQYTYDMIGKKFGDAWQAYRSFDITKKISSNQLITMQKLFNSINKAGSPELNVETNNDATAKAFLQSLVPTDQSQFKNLTLGTVVGLYYPQSKNYDLAFFQSAIGKQRMEDGSWYPLRSPYFCSNKEKCTDTLWKPNQENKTFYPGSTLRSGNSFIPTTHIGFIGYIDESGTPYVVHNVHKTVYAYPVSKMSKNTLSIIWAGDPNTID